MLIPQAVSDSNSPAVCDGHTGAWWTYRELAEQTSRLASALPIDKQLAFCLCRVDLPTIVRYLACLQRGHAVAMLDATMAAPARRELFNRYRPELILGDSPESWIPEAGYRECASGVWALPGSIGGIIDRELAVLLSTSGTTGSPVFVRLAARNVLANADSIVTALGINPHDRAIASLPFHYSYGLSVLNTHLRAGASIVLPPEGLISARFWDVVRQQGCTSFAGVPYSYQVLKRLKLETLDAPSLRTMTQAGGKLDIESIRHFHSLMRARGGQFFVMYGQTEACARIAVLPPGQLEEKLGSAGLPIPGGSFEILCGDDHRTRQEDIEGELIYTGPNVMLGYAERRADLAAGDQLQRTLHTGDLCRLDRDGFLYVIGRMKRDAKIFGLRINLDDVEAMLKSNGPTAVVEVSGRLVVFCEYGGDDLFAALRAELASRLRIHHGALEFHRLDRIPARESGKTDYAALHGMAS